MAPIPILGPDDLHFWSMETTEDMIRYEPGGITQLLSATSSARFQKTVRAGHATQTTDSNKDFVAVKVTAADGVPTREAAMLEAASKMQTNGERPPHVVTLLDHFTLHGPNGTHSVVVTDVAFPLLSLGSRKRPLPWRKAAYMLQQSFTETCTSGNIGLPIPQLADQDPHDVMTDLSPYDLTVFLPVAAANQTPSLPACVVVPCDLAKYYNEIAPQIYRR
ncbi:hypothetical protein BDZ97DRAFT_1921728 [Flammula alnicola]|nr:hypothetical protein BDZ97DRAFT_1921728 [Flammula alnicola]